MNFLKKLFGGGGGDRAPADSGIYLYVKDKRSSEVIRLRLEPSHELVLQDDGGYVTRRVVVGSRSFNRIDATFYFDRNRQLVNADINGGELVSADEWQPEPPSAPPPADSE